jgi:hypothetical protein
VTAGARTPMVHRVIVIGLLLLAGLVWPAAPGGALDSVTIDAVIDGRPVGDSTEREPIQLRPQEPASLDLRVTNAGTAPVQVRTVRLQGEVMGLTFFAYDTSVSFTVAPGTTEDRSFALDLVGLKGQATGLIRGSVAVLDGTRRTLTSERMIVDVRGSLWSVYGMFGLAVIVLTVLSLGGALLALARHQLPENRWRRGLRFLTPGLGLGLFAVFTLSALRVLVPRPGVWIPILLVTGGGALLAGYLTPSPDDEEEDGDGDLDGPPVGETAEGALER